MGVDVDDTGEYQHPGRIHDPVGAGRGPAEIRLDRGDDATIDGDVGLPRTCDGDHRPAADHEVCHGRVELAVSRRPR